MTSQQPGWADTQIRETLHRSEASLRLLAAQLPAIVWTTDASLRFTSVAGALQLWPERPPEWYHGKPLQSVLGWEMAELPIIPAHQQALRGEPAQYERQIGERVFDVRVQPLRDQQEIVGCLGLAIDISERARAEAARAAAEKQLLTQQLEAERLADREHLRRELIGSVSHDLRTPLTAARAALGLLESATGRREPEERRLLDNARRSLERLRLLIDDMIAANQLLIGADPPPLELLPLDMRTLVEAAAAPLATLMERMGQSLVYELPTGLRVRGDPARLQQAVGNLLANAHYHTGRGTRIILVGWQGPDGIRLTVQDSGPGISPEVARTLFQPLQRLRAEAVGSGLGLAVARGIVEQHGGRLWYEPAPEQGVSFHLVLPSAP